MVVAGMGGLAELEEASPPRRRLRGGQDATGRGDAGAPRSGERRGLGLALQMGGLRAVRSSVS